MNLRLAQYSAEQRPGSAPIITPALLIRWQLLFLAMTSAMVVVDDRGETCPAILPHRASTLESLLMDRHICRTQRKRLLSGLKYWKFRYYVCGSPGGCILGICQATFTALGVGRWWDWITIGGNGQHFIRKLIYSVAGEEISEVFIRRIGKMGETPNWQFPQCPRRAFSDLSSFRSITIVCHLKVTDGSI